MKTSSIVDTLDAAGMFDTMIRCTPPEKLWTVHTVPSVVCTSTVVPDRAQIIADYRSIATYTPTQGAKGSTWGEPHWPSQDEGERAADAVLGVREARNDAA